MICASGVVELAGSLSISRIVDEMQSRGLEIDAVEGGKVLFQIERKTIGEVKSEMNSLQTLDGIHSVHITYYSLEDCNEE